METASILKFSESICFSLEHAQEFDSYLWPKGKSSLNSTESREVDSKLHAFNPPQILQGV